MRSVLLALAAGACLLAVAGGAAARGGQHEVKTGDSIAAIARFYGVDPQALRELNDLDDKDVIRPGDVLAIPEVLVGGWTKSHVVRPGDTLVRVSKRYRVRVRELTELNRIGPDGQLRIGQRLVIPKGRRVDPAGAAAAGDAGEKATRWNGKATFVRVRDSERKTVTMFDQRGRVRTYARRAISRLARSKKGRVRTLNVRLIQLLGKVAEHFPGRTIDIISGYRPHKPGHRRSQHALGRAVDFRVRGVGNRELYEYVKTLPKVGVGYYPNSTFVHLDVRDRKYLWTDVSGPGEPARYVKPGELGAPEAATEETGGQPDPENFGPDELEGPAAPAAAE